MSSRLKEVAKKKEDILSKILKVDMKSLKVAKVAKRSPQSLQSVSSSYDMDTKVIANIQERINNPLFNITIADYELMCDNKMITKMMSKVLECDEKQLKKFCKYINVFKENINSSPKSIKNKMKPNLTINNLPEELRTQIVEKYKSLFPIKYVLRDWIPINKLNFAEISLNKYAIDFLKENKDKIYWDQLSKNPNAIELLQEKFNEEKKLKETNLEAFENLEDKDRINWKNLSQNINAIELLTEKMDEELELDEEEVDNLEDRDKINLAYLSSNPNAAELLKEIDDVDWDYLSLNPNPKVINFFLKENPHKINWEGLSSNPSAIKLLEKYYKEIDMFMLSANPNAIELLNVNYDQINWYNLCLNPNAIELLEEKIEEEKNMSPQELKELDIYNKINWDRLSINPNAIELLKNNPTKIDWVYLSKNPNAIELLKKNLEKINWELLSENSNAIELIKDRVKYECNLSKQEYDNLPNKINWDILSTNPAIFEAI